MMNIIISLHLASEVPLINCLNYYHNVQFYHNTHPSFLLSIMLSFKNISLTMSRDKNMRQYGYDHTPKSHKLKAGCIKGTSGQEGRRAFQWKPGKGHEQDTPRSNNTRGDLFSGSARQTVRSCQQRSYMPYHT